MKELTKRIIAFKNSPATKELRELYSTNSLMEIYGVNRKEIRHTSFLKWLFSTNCPVSKPAIGYLIDILISSKFFNKNTIEIELYNRLLLGKYSINSLCTRENYTENVDGEIDLIIECCIDQFTIQIIIENKVSSSEHNQQTQRYYDSIINKKNEKINAFFVYLTPISSIQLELLTSPQCTCKEYIQINYQNILDLIITPLLDGGVDNSTYNILTDYVIALRNPVKNTSKKHQFMAISKEESNLLTQFWEENQDLIKKAVVSLQENPHVEPGLRTTAKNIANQFNTNNGKEKIGKFVQRELKQLATENLISNEEVEKMMSKEKSKEIFDIQYPLLQEKKHDFSPNHYWKNAIMINDVCYYVCCEWHETDKNNDRVYFEKWLKQFNKN